MGRKHRLEIDTVTLAHSKTKNLKSVTLLG